MSIPVFVETLGWTSADETALQNAQAMPWGTGEALAKALLARKTAESEGGSTAPGGGSTAPGGGGSTAPYSGGDYPPAPSGPPWGLILAGAAGLLLLGGGALVVMRRRRAAPALSGYCHARRRR